MGGRRSRRRTAGPVFIGILSQAGHRHDADQDGGERAVEPRRGDVGRFERIKARVGKDDGKVLVHGRRPGRRGIWWEGIWVIGAEVEKVGRLNLYADGLAHFLIIKDKGARGRSVISKGNRVSVRISKRIIAILGGIINQQASPRAAQTRDRDEQAFRVKLIVAIVNALAAAIRQANKSFPFGALVHRLGHSNGSVDKLIDLPIEEIVVLTGKAQNAGGTKGPIQRNFAFAVL